MLARIHYLLKQTRKPMHDVKRQLSIVDAGTIHAELHPTRSSHLRGKHRGFAEHNHATLAKSENNSLGPTRGGDCSLLGNLDLHRRRTRRKICVGGRWHLRLPTLPSSFDGRLDVSL